MIPSGILRHAVLGLTVLVVVAIAGMFPPLPQPLSYHAFADQRTVSGIPNAFDVLSNVPFAVVGLLGLAVTFSQRGSHAFSDPWERWPYAALFAGVALTSLGSGYYHLHPDNARLVWDRLPMSVGFMGLLTALLAERVSLSASRWLFGPLLALGAASVGCWYWSELQNVGDLRPYLVVQFGSLLLVVLLLVLYPAPYVGTHYLVSGLAAYAAAKGFEVADQQVFALGQIVSGHTVKHLIAAAGVACIVAMLQVRTQCAVRLAERRVQASAGV